MPWTSPPGGGPPSRSRHRLLEEPDGVSQSHSGLSAVLMTWPSSRLILFRPPAKPPAVDPAPATARVSDLLHIMKHRARVINYLECPRKTPLRRSRKRECPYPPGHGTFRNVYVPNRLSSTRSCACCQRAFAPSLVSSHTAIQNMQGYVLTFAALPRSCIGFR